MLGIYLASGFCFLLGFALLMQAHYKEASTSAKISLFGVELEVQRAAPGTVLSLFGLVILLAGLFSIRTPAIGEQPSAKDEQTVLVCSPGDAQKILELYELSNRIRAGHIDPSDRLVFRLAALSKALSDDCLANAEHVLEIMEVLQERTARRS